MDVQTWLSEHHVSYEVTSNYRVLEDGRKVLAGFDIDVYGVSPDDDRLVPAAAHDYALGYSVVQQLVAEVVRDAGDSCSLEVIPFPGSIVVDSRGFGNVKATLRITISHLGPLDQPAGVPENLALERVKEGLDALGIARR